MVSRMGLYDTVLLVDEKTTATCPHGHRLRSLQTKDLGASMSTYVVLGDRLFLASSRRWLPDDDWAAWRIEGNEAVREQRYALEEFARRMAIRVYGSCDGCEPVLVRTDASDVWGDIVHEHTLVVDFELTFRPGEPVAVERLTGTREDMRAELRSRGLHVLAEDEPLALAHRELKRAREAARRPG
jgi:hypothetical protein